MKKMFFCAAFSAFLLTGHAQMTPASPTTSATSPAPALAQGERSEWLPVFAAVEVNAPVDIRFVRVPETQAPRIIYDTKGSYTTKFKAEVRDKVLRITERTDSRRPERTTVAVEYNDLRNISLEDCKAQFDAPLVMPMLDLSVSGTAMVELKVEVKDISASVSGRSSLVITGSARYFSLYASGSGVAAGGLEVMSAQVSAAASAAVDLWVTERLEAKTTTGAKIAYKGAPSIVRETSKFMGGDISAIK